MITDKEILEAADRLHTLVENQWYHQHFLSATWFGHAALIIFAYILFFSLVDKRRFIEILLYGSLVGVAFSVYDSVGEQLKYWTTLEKVLPFSPNFFLGDLTLIPLTAMLVYQYTHSWKSYLIWITLWAGFLSFVVYNIIFEYFKIFAYLKAYAVIIDFTLFIIVGVIARWILISLFKIQAKRGNRASELSLSDLIGRR